MGLRKLLLTEKVEIMKAAPRRDNTDAVLSVIWIMHSCMSVKAIGAARNGACGLLVEADW